jgi:hypothetical protein
MSKCNITTTFTGSADDLFLKIKTQVENNHGTISGDSSAGIFKVPLLGSSIKGKYTIIAQNLTVEIEKKPIVM